ncbi:PR domain zinc finger protein 5-like [Aedes albopictus]|uniref:C2H2-type domain-containing protein n=1 Tax=Aedes albopictus TaxID=7160 RepID=A0ABM1ZGK7_AEDAL|nr:PR domain zinc finger protein 5-like [Aedes albopictus]
MPPQEEFVNCTVCQTSTTRFTIIKGDRLCSQCLTASTYASNVSTFKVEFVHSDENGSNKTGPPNESLAVKIESTADSIRSQVIKTEPNADDGHGSIPCGENYFERTVGAYRSGSLPEGVLVQIPSDLRHDPHTRDNLGNASSSITPASHLNDHSIQVKLERIEEDDDDKVMQTESQSHSAVQTTEDTPIKEEITFEEPCMREVDLGPIERKPSVKCPHCDKCFPNRGSLHQHVRRIHEAKPLNCDVCDAQFANTDRLNYHKRTAHESPQLQCPQCPKKFALPNGLKKHILTHSAPKKDRRPECDICGRKFKSRVRLQQHMERKTVHQERKCPVCEVVIMGFERFEEHMTTHPKPPKTPHRLKEFKVACKYCDHKTTSKTLLRKHNDECHAEERTIRCRICFIWCNGRDLFEKHVQEEHQGNQRQCEICLEGCVELAELEEHKRNCLGRLLFKCQACQERYVKQEAAQKHVEQHQESEGTSQNVITEIRSLQKIFNCALCGDDRAYEEELYNTHVKDVHNGYHILCPDCGAKFRLHRSFVNHRSSQCQFGERSKDKVSTMYAPVITQCEHCPRSFKNRWRMEEHIRRIHKAKPAECDICGLKLASASLVKSHKRSVHTEASIQCPHCEKKFVSKYYFQSHLLCHQEGTHLCEECGGKYKTKQILKKHIDRVHNPNKGPRIKIEPGGEQPSSAASSAGSTELVKCAICEKDFKGPERLRIHMKIHDPNRKQYACEMCDATFVTRIGLRQHMANEDVHHEVTCAVCGTYFRSRDRYEEHMLRHADGTIQE